MIKVAIVEPVGGHGGMNYYDMSLLKGALDHCESIFLYTSEETEVVENLRPYTFGYFKGVWGKGNKLVRAFNFVVSNFKVCFHAKGKKVNVFHFHFFHYSVLELFSILLARLFKFKVVLTVHDVESFSEKSFFDFSSFIFKLSKQLIVHNNVSRKSLLCLDDSLESKINVIPHGHYLDYISSRTVGDVEGKVFSVDDEITILFFGQIKEVKGLDILIESLPDVIKLYPKLKLVIAGKVWKTDFSSYQELIDKHNLNDNITLIIRYIEDSEVSAFYESADIVILPYKKIYQSGVLLMAMSYQKPVIVSNLEGMIEIVKNDYNGFVFQSENSKDLSETIIRAINSDLRNVAINGLKTVKAKHDWSLIGKQTVNVYRKSNEE